MTGPTLRHALVTPTDGLHTPWYYQVADPGAKGAGVVWVVPVPDATTPTSFLIRQRNAANTAWFLLFDTSTIGGAPSSHAASHAAAGGDPVTLTMAQITGLVADLLTYLKVDGSRALTGNQSAGGNKITSLGDGTSAGDAINKGQLDAAVAGIKWKATVRVATTADVNLTTGLEDLDVIDGVTLGTGDRVLVKNQSTASQNGIYIVQASGAAVRATDFDAGSEVVGAAVLVDQGTANADKMFQLLTNAPITIGVTNLTFQEFSGVGVSDHGALSGLTDDDHPQYSKADGSRPFTNPVGGVDPVAGSDLATKDYVDDEIAGVTGGGSGVVEKRYGKLSAGASWETIPQYRATIKQVVVTQTLYTQFLEFEARNEAAGADDQVSDWIAYILTDVAGAPGIVIAASRAGGTLLDSASGGAGDGVSRTLQIPLAGKLTPGTYWIGLMQVSTASSVQITYDTGGSDRKATAGGVWAWDWGWYTPTTTSNEYGFRLVGYESGSAPPAWVTALWDQHPDAWPVSPNAEDDEFAGVALDAKWTNVQSCSLSFASSRMTVTLPAANQGNEFRQAYAPGASTAFTVTAKFTGVMISEGTDYFGIMAMDSSNTHIAAVDYRTTDGSQAKFHKDNPGGSADVTLANGTGDVYLRISRDASNNYTMSISFDGVAWIPAHTGSSATTVAKVGFRFGQTQTRSYKKASIDWFRRS